MPEVTTADLSTLRDLTPHMTKLGMAVLLPTVCVTAQVVGGDTGDTLLVLTNVSTSHTPERHFTVWAGTDPLGQDGGKARMKEIDGNLLAVGRNNIQWDIYPYITIVQVVEPHVILPDLQNDAEDATITYDDANTKYMPLVRIGAPYVAILNGAASVTTKHYATAKDFAGAGGLSYAWTFPGGTPGTSATQGTVASPVSVSWSNVTGQTPHYVKCKVTDANGKTHTRYSPVWVFNTIDDAYTNFELESCSGSYDAGGWTARVRVSGDATPTEFPVDSMVVIFAEDYYAGHRTSIGGSPHQENIVFVGWIARDSVHKDADTGAVSFDILGPVDKMRQMNAWPANLEDKGTPTKWHQLHDMTCDLAAHHILTQHTTMDHICDFTPTASTKRMRYIDIPEQDPYSQIDEYVYKPIGARLLSDRVGRLYASQNPNLMPPADRSGIDVVLTLSLDDIRSDPGLDIAEEEQQKQVAQVDFIGFGYDGADVSPYYSLAPEYQHDCGRIEKIDGIRADTQDEANILAGLYIANLNNIWRELRVPSFNYRVWDIAPEEWTKVTLTAAQTKRGLVWTNQQFICRAVEIEFNRDRATLYVTPTFEKSSTAETTGVTNPDYPDTPPGPSDNPEPVPPIYPPTTPAGDSLFVFDAVNGCWYCPPNTTTWEARNGARTPIADVQGGWDPFYWTPQKNGTRDAEFAILWACQVGKIWRSIDGGKSWVDRTPTTDPPNSWSDSPAPTVANLTFVVRTDNIHADGHHYFLARWVNGASNWRTWLLKTTDDGLTWTWAAPWLNIVSGELVTNGTFPFDISGWTDGGSWSSGRMKMEFRALSDTFARQTIVAPIAGTYNVSADFTRQAGYNSVVILKRDTGAVLSWGTTETGAKSGTMTMTAGNHTLELNCGFYGAGGTYGYWDNVSVPYGEGMPTSMYPVWMDTDSQDGTVLWITAWIDGTYYLLKCFTADLSYSFKVSLGAATIAQVLAKTYTAFPRTPPFDKTYCAVYGRMQNPQALANPAHIIRTIDGGANFVLVESGWGADYCGALEIDTEVGGTRTYSAVRNSATAVPKFYRGQNAVAYVSDFPFASGAGVLADALTGTIGKIAFGVNAAGAVMIVHTLDNGVTWENITNNFPVTGSIKSAVYP